jgi:hypothetical protein
MKNALVSVLSMVIISLLMANVTIAARIVSSTSEQFTEGSMGYANITVSNEQTAGDFELRIINCPPEFSSSGPHIFVLSTGEQRTETFELGCGSTSMTQPVITGTCTVQMTERTTGDEVTSQLPVSCKQMNECTPGDTWKVMENGVWVVRLCDSNGLTSQVILTCKQGEEPFFISGINWECRNMQSNTLASPQDTIIGFLGFVVIVVVIVFIARRYGKKKSKR